MIKSSTPAAQPESDNGHLARDKEGMEGTCLPPEKSQPKTAERCQVASEGAPAEKAKQSPGPRTHQDAGHEALCTGAGA